jgi:hypothetical protein
MSWRALALRALLPRAARLRTSWSTATMLDASTANNNAGRNDRAVGEAALP